MNEYSPIVLPAHGGARRALKARLAAFNYIALGDVDQRIRRAILTLMAQPDSERNWLRVKSNWPECLKEALDPASEQFVRNEQLNQPNRFQPTPQDVARYLDDLSWLNALTEKEQNLIYWRAKEFAYRDIAEWMSARMSKKISENGAKYAYKSAISNCWLAAALTYEREIAQKNRQGQRASGAGGGRAVRRG